MLEKNGLAQSLTTTILFVGPTVALVVTFLIHLGLRLNLTAPVVSVCAVAVSLPSSTGVFLTGLFPAHPPQRPKGSAHGGQGLISSSQALGWSSLLPSQPSGDPASLGGQPREGGMSRLGVRGGQSA